MISYKSKTECFIKRFNCAAHQARKMAPQLILEFSEYQIFGLKPIPYSYGARISNLYWTLNKQDEYIHPFSLMLAGTRHKYHNAFEDLEHSVYGIPGMIDIFRQGTTNIPDYRDCWAFPGMLEQNAEYYRSLYFQLGRAFLHKFCNIKLEYSLPLAYKKMFQELK